MVTESGEASLTTPVADADAVARTDGRVAVIGLGYTGLPLAIAFIEAGLQVEAIDANLLRVAELSQRRSPIDDISDERLGAALDAGLRVVGVDDGRLGGRRRRVRRACPRRSRPPRIRTSRRS